MPFPARSRAIRTTRKRWKKDVLEAYLGVTLKRQFSTGPEAFDEIYRRLEQFTRSLTRTWRWRRPAITLPPAVVETVTSLALAIDAKDHYTQGHSQKVSAYAVMIAQALGMNHAEVEEIRLAGLLHDIGKVGIPEAILNKSGPLDAAEWETMKTHTELGAQILEPLAAMNRIREMVRHHHEFFDGTGYPDRLERRSDSPRRARHRHRRRLRHHHVRAHLQKSAHPRRRLLRTRALRRQPVRSRNRSRLRRSHAPRPPAAHRRLRRRLRIRRPRLLVAIPSTRTRLLPIPHSSKSSSDAKNDRHPESGAFASRRAEFLSFFLCALCASAVNRLYLSQIFLRFSSVSSVLSLFTDSARASPSDHWTPPSIPAKV